MVAPHTQALPELGVRGFAGRCIAAFYLMPLPGWPGDRQKARVVSIECTSAIHLAPIFDRAATPQAQKTFTNLPFPT